MSAPRLHVTHLVRTSSFAGVERYLTYLAPAQAAQGLDVTVIGGDPARLAPALDGTGVVHQASGTVTEDLRGLKPASPASLVHSHMTDADLVAVLGKLRYRRPVVSTLHFAKPRGRDRLRRIALRSLPRFLDSQIAISRFVADAAGELDAVVIPNGVPWSYESAPRDDVVLVAQRLESEKDTATAVRAWAMSGLAERGWRMTIAGEGSQRASIEALVRQLAVGSSVELVGAVDDIPQRQARCGIFLAPAPAEPFGLSVVEAMAAGTPVVAAGGGAHLETVGRIGIQALFTPGEAAAAASALTRLADDPTERAVAGAALRDEYQAAFTIERHAQSVLDLYSEVLGRRS